VVDTVYPRTGYQTRFTPQDAHKTMLIIADYSRSGIVLHDTVQVRVVPSPSGRHMVLEGTADMSVSPNNDNPLYSLTLTSRDTISYAYAIVRDLYGNFVDYSRSTTTGPGRGFQQHRPGAYGHD